MIGVISQNKKEFAEKHYYISDYLNDKDNNSWIMLASKEYYYKYDWELMWKNIFANQHVPTVLLYVK